MTSLFTSLYIFSSNIFSDLFTITKAVKFLEIPTQMFKSPFSFHGRISKTEYGISFIIYALAAIMITIIAGSGEGPQVIFIFYLPLLWMVPALGAKRCHDLNHSSWYVLIPFYVLWLLFAEGTPGRNHYGPDPDQEDGLNQVMSAKSKRGVNLFS
jgi:uncharacterized membrane protein YhaH (DUF805 family)